MMHSQAVEFKLPGGEVEFVGQSVHDDAPDAFMCFFAGQMVQFAGPVVSLNVVGGQGVHGPPSGPKYPGMHEHADIFVEWDGAVEKSGHAEHDHPWLVMFVVLTMSGHTDRS